MISRLKASNASERSAAEELKANAVGLLPLWRLYTGGWSQRDEPVVLERGPPSATLEGAVPMDETDKVLDPDVLLEDCPTSVRAFRQSSFRKTLGRHDAVQACAGRGLNVLRSITLPGQMENERVANGYEC